MHFGLRAEQACSDATALTAVNLQPCLCSYTLIQTHRRKEHSISAGRDVSNPGAL